METPTQSLKQDMHYTTLLENAGNNVDWLPKSVVQDVVLPAVNVVPPAAKSVSTYLRHIISNTMYGKYLPALGLGIQWSHLVVFTENTSGLTALGIFNKNNSERSLNFPAPGRNVFSRSRFTGKSEREMPGVFQWKSETRFEYQWCCVRPAGVWLVTRPAGGGGGKGPPEISQTTGPISKFQAPFDSPVRELPVQGQKFDPEVTDDVTGQVKVRILDFGLGDIGE